MVELDGIGSTQLNSIENFFSNEKNKKIINELINYLKIIDFSIKNKRKICKQKINVYWRFSKNEQIRGKIYRRK